MSVSKSIRKRPGNDQGRGALILGPWPNRHASARELCRSLIINRCYPHNPFHSPMALPQMGAYSAVTEGRREMSRFRIAEVAQEMSKMETMSRVLVDHNWTSIEEWVRALRDLADLDDQALDKIQSMHNLQGNGTTG